jgi:hypothetical protein
MKQMMTALTLLTLSAAVASSNDSGAPQTNRTSATRLCTHPFKDVHTSAERSDSYKHIAIGSPLADVITLKDTPLPKGLYWPEHCQLDGSVNAELIAMPPESWGTNFVARTDGQSRKEFYFFHDKSVVIRIVWTELELTVTPPKGPEQVGGVETIPEPVGPLIMMEENKK